MVILVALLNNHYLITSSVGINRSILKKDIVSSYKIFLAEVCPTTVN